MEICLGLLWSSESPCFTLWRDFMHRQRELNAQLRPLGLIQPPFAVLAVCGWMTRNAEEVTQREVVDFLGLDRMHISQIATRLEGNGLVERPAATADTRAKRIMPTAKGRELLVEAMPLVEEFDRRFFSWCR